MNNYVDGKVIVVTGAAGGFGKVLSSKAAQLGGRMVCADINTDALQDSVQEIVNAGGTALAMEVDVTKADSMNQLVDQALDAYGQVDVLINNVGMEELGLFIDSTEESWDWKIAVNLKGPMTVTKAVLEGMVPRKYGRIVNISSDAGRAGEFGEAAYGACKAGIIALTKTWARELMEHNITVNSVSPFATTPGHVFNGKRWSELDAFKKSPPSTPKLYGRAGTPEEMAAAVAFFASDEAGYITGQTLSVNGGRFMF